MGNRLMINRELMRKINFKKTESMHLYNILRSCMLFLLLIGCQFIEDNNEEVIIEPETIEQPTAEGVKVSIDATQIINTVSPMIQGYGLVYSLEPDALYADGTMADLYKKVGASYLRYPGGTVTTIVEEISYFNELMTSLGKPNIKLASMEWNLGPGTYRSDPDHTPFKSTLMQSEMQLQMMQGGLEIASL